MALTYYIRSWDPRSTYPTNPQEGDICYTITLDQTWAPVGGVKKDNIVKEEIYQNGAWVEQGGGGGSDLPMFSVTATSSGGFPPSFVFSDAACEVAYADLLAMLDPGDSMPVLLTMTLGNGTVLEYGGNVYNMDGTTLQAQFSGTSAGNVTMQYTSSGIVVQ